MKFWEVLKAIDEGKTVQRKLNDGWATYKNLDGWMISPNNDRHEWRIKPEPRVFYADEYTNGNVNNIRTFEHVSERIHSVINPYVGTIKLVEVIE